MSERTGVTRLLCVVVGLWIALTVSMGFVATGNFHVVELDQLRNASEVFEDIPEGEPRRQALRYVASELNRYFFAEYDRANLAVGLVALVLLGLAGRRRKVEALFVLVGCGIAAASMFYTTPLMTDLGREIDFLPRDPKPPKVLEFYRYHGFVIGAELVKLGLLTVTGLSLLRGGNRRRSEH